MAKRLFGLVAILAASLFMAGCFESDDSTDNGGGGGGNNNLDCSFTACGGDVVGTWNSYGSCMNMGGYEQVPGCENLVVDSSDLDFNGSATFNADGTYTSEGSVGGDIREVIDDACIAAMTGGQVDGATYCQGVSAALAASGDPDMTGSCSYADGACTCTITLAAQDTSGEGTYTVSGNSLVIDGEASDFCVSGNELKLSQGGGQGLLIFHK